MKHYRWLCIWFVSMLLLTGTTWASPVNPWLDSGTDPVGGNAFTDAAHRRAVATLAGLNVLTNETLFAETAQESITRLEAAEMLLALSGRNGAEFQSAAAFKDVKSGAAAVGYVTAEKLMTGYTDGTFRPEAGLSYNEAVRAVVELMGYRPYALLRGGDAAGYQMTANQYGLVKRLQKPEAGAAVTKLSFALCLYDLLDLSVLVGYEYGTETKYGAGEPLLKHYRNIGQGKAVVEATEFGTLNAQQSVLHGAVRIGGVDYSLSTFTQQKRYDTAQLLGYRVYYYYSDETDPSLVFLWQDESVSEAVRIEAGDVTAFTGSRLEADHESGEQKWYAISTLANVIRNGRYTGRKAHAFTLESLVPSTGYITLVDQNLDGEYDVILVEAYRNVLVDEVSTSAYRVRDKFSGESISFSRQDLERLPLISQGGRVVSLSNLQPWQAVGVLVSDDGELIQIRIPSPTAVSGVVTELSGDTVTIDGEPYRLSFDDGLGAEEKKPDYAASRITVGLSGSFSLNVEGRVIAVQRDALSAMKRVGYLIAAGRGEGLDDALHVKIMSQDGELIELESKAAFRLNGNANGTAEQALAVLRPNGGETVQQIVRYRTNGQGKLVMLATAFDPNLSGNQNVAPDDDQPLFDSYRASRTWRSAQSKFEYNGRDVDPSYREFHIDKDTVVFTIPNQYNGSGDDVRFGVAGMSIFSNDANYTVEAYNMDDTYTADFVVANAQGGTYISANDAPVALVTRMGQAVGQDGDETVRFHLLYNGTEEAYTCRSDVKAYLWFSETQQLELDDFSKGDVVRVALDDNGEIGAIAKVYPREKNEKPNVPQATFTSNHGAYPELTYGLVLERSGLNLGVQAADGPTLPKLIFRLTGATVYVYDVKSDRMYVGDVSDIYAQKYTSDASYVMLRVKDNAVGEVIVYNYNR